MRRVRGRWGIALLLSMSLLVVAAVAGVMVLVAGVSARGSHAGVAAVSGAGAGRVVSLQDGQGRAIQVTADDQSQLDAFIACMLQHGVDISADFGKPTPDTLPTVPPSTGPTPSEEVFDQAVKACEQLVPGVLSGAGATK